MAAPSLQLIHPTKRTIFDLEDVVRETLVIARECDLIGDVPNQLFVELVAAVVVARLQKGSVR